MNEPLETPETLQEAILYFSDPDISLAYLSYMRWPDGIVICPTCGSSDAPFQPSRRLWKCKNEHAKRQFSIKIGTIMEDSALSLEKWLPAMWLVANDKNGISSHELARALGITQKSAWHMLHRIRLAMQDGNVGQMSGTNEVDESFIGGKARFMHKNRRDAVIKGTGGMGKAIVVGILSRHGGPGHSTIRATVAPDRSRRTLLPLVRKHVEVGSTVYTDALPSYNGLAPDYMHEAIDHAETYVNGAVHTNGIENFWSLLKRAIHGTYISVEPFHLFRYIDEEAFRFNHRQASDASRFLTVIANIIGKRLTYDTLTGKDDKKPSFA